MTFQNGNIPWNKGKRMSEIMRKRLIKNHVGFSGKSHSQETKEKIRKAIKGENRNEANGMWKGNMVGYKGLHTWVRRRLVKPSLCQVCKRNPPYDLANIRGDYKRELMGWQWICRRCHMRLDGRINNLMRGKFLGWVKV